MRLGLRFGCFPIIPLLLGTRVTRPEDSPGWVDVFRFFLFTLKVCFSVSDHIRWFPPYVFVPLIRVLYPRAPWKLVCLYMKKPFSCGTVLIISSLLSHEDMDFFIDSHLFCFFLSELFSFLLSSCKKIHLSGSCPTMQRLYPGWDQASATSCLRFGERSVFEGSLFL